MVNYILNGVELAAFPTIDTSKYMYALVLDIRATKTDDFNYDYCVYFSSEGFAYGTASVEGVVVQTISFPSAASILPYACKTTSTSWTKISVTTSGGNYERTAVPLGSEFQWTSHDIPNLDTGAIKYNATDIQYHVFAATPSISPNLDNSKNYTYFQGDYVVGFRISASSSDSNSGGVLSYQWYRSKDGVAVAISGATNKAYMPSTADLGTYQYYCIVTNTYESYTSQSVSNVVTVVVCTKDSILPKTINIDHRCAAHGWIVGKLLQSILTLDSDADDAALVNGILHIFNGQATLIENTLEVT